MSTRRLPGAPDSLYPTCTSRRVSVGRRPTDRPAMDFGGWATSYLQSKLFCDHCVNQLVRPTRIPPRQSVSHSSHSVIGRKQEALPGQARPIGRVLVR